MSKKLKMEEHAYRALPAVNISTLKEMDKSPAHYFESVNNKEYFKPTEAMTFGSAFHCLMLERELFPEKYTIYENIDRRTKSGKAAYEELKNSGKTPIKQSDYQTMELMVSSLRSNPEVVELMKNTEREITYMSEINDIMCKGRLDAVKDSAIIDIKTTENSHPKAFDYHARKYGYYTQAQFYRQLTGIENFFIIAVEKKPPFGHNIFAIEESNTAQQRINEWLETLKKCRKSGEYPAYKNQVFYLSE